MKGKKAERVVVIERRGKRRADEAEEIEAVLAAEGEEATEDSEKLSEFMENFGGQSYQVRVEKFNDAAKRWEYVDAFPYESFDPFKTCREFGAGEYQLSLLNDHGKYVKTGYRPRLSISAVAVKKVEEVKRVEEQDPLKNPVVALILQQQQENSKSMLAFFQAMVSRPEPARPASTEILDMMTRLEALRPKEDAAKKLFDALMPVLLQRALDPERRESEESLASQIKDVLGASEALGPVLDRFRGQRRLPAQQPKAITAKEAPAVNPIAEALKSYVPQFVRWAKRNEDPEAAADFLVGELEGEVVPLVVENYRPLGITLSPDTVWTELIKRAQVPAEVEIIFMQAPELAPHREWVQKVVAAAVIQVTSPVPADAPPAGANGNGEPQA